MCRQTVRPARADRADEADRSSLISVDRDLERWFVGHRTGVLNPVFEGLSIAGRLGLVWIGIALLLALLYRRWGLLGLTIVAVALADASATGLKEVFDRPRPPLRYPEPDPLVAVPDTGSFPSGHAATSFAGATLLGLAFPRLAPLLYLLAAAIAFSRVYLGVHYPLDIVGGAAVGTALALALRFLALRRQRKVREEGSRAPRRREGGPRQ